MDEDSCYRERSGFCFTLFVLSYMNRMVGLLILVMRKRVRMVRVLCQGGHEFEPG